MIDFNHVLNGMSQATQQDFLAAIRQNRMPDHAALIAAQGNPLPRPDEVPTPEAPPLPSPPRVPVRYG